ncbi:hypothetical protein M5K25_013567 [Dendrobium thyrsiflorum]|uniref:Uncharacterized protein n=1 Tax=Dendrobium thyrsiflorum TaxID=117978 RepID=A0ABD0UUC3_DENTH
MQSMVGAAAPSVPHVTYNRRRVRGGGIEETNLQEGLRSAESLVVGRSRAKPLTSSSGKNLGDKFQSSVKDNFPRSVIRSQVLDSHGKPSAETSKGFTVNGDTDDHKTNKSGTTYKFTYEYSIVGQGEPESKGSRSKPPLPPTEFSYVSLIFPKLLTDRAHLPYQKSRSSAIYKGLAKIFEQAEKRIFCVKLYV